MIFRPIALLGCLYAVNGEVVGTAPDDVAQGSRNLGPFANLPERLNILKLLHRSDVIIDEEDEILEDRQIVQPTTNQGEVVDEKIIKPATEPALGVLTTEAAQTTTTSADDSTVTSTTTKAPVITHLDEIEQAAQEHAVSEPADPSGTTAALSEDLVSELAGMGITRPATLPIVVPVVPVEESTTAPETTEAEVESGETTAEGETTTTLAEGETTAAETTEAEGEFAETTAEGETTTTAEGETTVAETTEAEGEFAETTEAEGETTAAETTEAEGEFAETTAEGETTTTEAEGETTAAEGETTAAETTEAEGEFAETTAEGETTTTEAEGETTAAETTEAEGEFAETTAEGETTTTEAEGETTVAEGETTVSETTEAEGEFAETTVEGETTTVESETTAEGEMNETTTEADGETTAAETTEVEDEIAETTAEAETTSEGETTTEEAFPEPIIAFTTEGPTTSVMDETSTAEEDLTAIPTYEVVGESVSVAKSAAKNAEAAAQTGPRDVDVIIKKNGEEVRRTIHLEGDIRPVLQKLAQDERADSVYVPLRNLKVRRTVGKGSVVVTAPTKQQSYYGSSSWLGGLWNRAGRWRKW